MGMDSKSEDKIKETKVDGISVRMKSKETQTTLTFLAELRVKKRKIER